eukprot:jgi/Botrbrau1/13688/Bobra.0378s0017.1
MEPALWRVPPAGAIFLQRFQRTDLQRMTKIQGTGPAPRAHQDERFSYVVLRRGGRPSPCPDVALSREPYFEDELPEGAVPATSQSPPRTLVPKAWLRAGIPEAFLQADAQMRPHAWVPGYELREDSHLGDTLQWDDIVQTIDAAPCDVAVQLRDGPHADSAVQGNEAAHFHGALQLNDAVHRHEAANCDDDARSDGAVQFGSEADGVGAQTAQEDSHADIMAVPSSSTLDGMSVPSVSGSVAEGSAVHFAPLSCSMAVPCSSAMEGSEAIQQRIGSDMMRVPSSSTMVPSRSGPASVTGRGSLPIEDHGVQSSWTPQDGAILSSSSGLGPSTRERLPANDGWAADMAGGTDELEQEGGEGDGAAEQEDDGDASGTWEDYWALEEADTQRETALASANWSRIVRPPRRHNKHVVLEICSARAEPPYAPEDSGGLPNVARSPQEGVLLQQLVTQGDKKTWLGAPGYRLARKARWGTCGPPTFKSGCPRERF